MGFTWFKAGSLRGYEIVTKIEQHYREKSLTGTKYFQVWENFFFLKKFILP